MGNAEHFKDTTHSSFRDALSHARTVEASAADGFRDEVIPAKPPESSLSSTVSKGYTVLKDIAYGAADELINHKSELLLDAAFGAGIGMTAKLEPKMMLGAGLATTGIIGAGVYARGDDFLTTLKVATGPDSPDFQPKFEAERSLQRLGAKSVELATMVVAGVFAHRILGNSARFAGAGAMNEMSTLTSPETAHSMRFTDSIRKSALPKGSEFRHVELP
ncbi:MAG: hypothetical protein P4L53_18215 [Candidatus Obscuribacterales bacterium]|nr:hypothetical protein [Candidatus Obscuribacterales bacterium]